MSNLARFVIIIWVFVVLILTQSYTASLTSLLTAEQLRPTVANVSQLIKDRNNVGYLEASFVQGLLKGLGFNDPQIKVYKSIDELEEAFSNYTNARGGIAAAFDENPYMNLFLRKFCSKYTTIDPTFKTDGFGFAFPRGSPLVSDVSRAILEVTEGDILKKIESKWFGEKKTCPDLNALASSSSLGLESFWGLFLIAGVSSLLALAIHTFKFWRQNRRIIESSVPVKASLLDRISVVFRVFDQRDFSSHTFRKRDVSRTVEAQGDSRVVPVDQDTASAMQTSPSRHSNDSAFHFVSSSPEQRTPAIGDEVLTRVSDVRREDVQINTGTG